MYERKTRIGMKEKTQTGKESLDYIVNQQKLDVLKFLKTRQVKHRSTLLCWIQFLLFLNGHNFSLLYLYF